MPPGSPTASARSGGFFDAPALADQLAAIEDRMTAPGFWDNREAAQKDMERVSSIKAKLGPLAQLELRVGDLEILKEMALEEQEHASKVQASAEVAKEFHALSGEIEKFELRQLLSGEFDKNDAFIIINAGAGGTESCDWADMLMRMYKRWIERSGFTASVVDIQEGDEAGIKASLRGIDMVLAPNLNLARSPLNKDETAVRMTHIPSGVVVACQAERSQLKNRVLALKMIKVKLYQIEADRKRAEIDRQYSEKGEIAWGSQIRSYVFQPYQMVKDHRTGVQTGNVQEVMDGDLDAFIEAKLRGVKKGAGADNDDDL